MMKTTALVVILMAGTLNAYATYDEALKLFMEKKYSQSLKKLADILVVEDDMKPDSPNYRIRFLAAHVHWKLGNLESATAHFNRCMAIKKERVEPYIDLGLMMLDFKKPGMAEMTARRGLGVKKDPMLYFVIGRASMERNNFWRAKQFFEKTNSLDPELFISYHYLGISLARLKKYSEANTAFSAASVIKPNVPETLNNLAVTYEFMGKKKKALEVFKKALKYDSDNEIIQNSIKRLEEKIK